MADTAFVARPYHRLWLLGQARDLLTFFGRHSLNPKGGFNTLDDAGQPLLSAPRGTGPMQELFYTCRMVHCYAAGHLLGHPGAKRMVDQGMAYLLDHHHDRTYGGFFWGVDETGAVRPEKLAYGHAFVLLAAASAQEIGHPDAPRLRDLATQTLLTQFWDEAAGALREEFTQDWTPLSEYRGQNANMHAVEALMAAFEAFGDQQYLAMAERIADLIIHRHARAAGWEVIEHFHADWTPDTAYIGDPIFRPSGTTPGHSLEWARLLIQLWHLGRKARSWMPEAAAALFRTACRTGWDNTHGGFVYTLDDTSRPDQKQRLWWPSCEGAAAAASLYATTEEKEFELWYRDIWSVLDREFIDPQGGWWPQARSGQGAGINPFAGKPDIYHALQACLIPLVPPSQGLNHALSDASVIAKLIG
ncbi:MAG: AGE family epimerase/isomerase [Pseudomonadota bacterium]